MNLKREEYYLIYAAICLMKMYVCNYYTIRFHFETFSGSPNTSLDSLNQKGRQISPSSSLTLSLDRSSKFMHSPDKTLSMVCSTWQLIIWIGAGILEVFFTALIGNLYQCQLPSFLHTIRIQWRIPPKLSIPGMRCLILPT